MIEMTKIPAIEMLETFHHILLGRGMRNDKAFQCAEIFTNNSVDGIYTHGVNRFPRFIQNIDMGIVNVNAVPSLKNKYAAMEQWDGNLGPGPLNAIHATEMAIKLSRENGIACIALSNTNHWMRGGTYGWHAAKAGFAFIGWTNTIANMPAWGSGDIRLGNNPLVMGLPFGDEAIVLDMAMSQYSYGAMEHAKMKGEILPVYAGYDKFGELTKDPSTILESQRPLPVGFWKGAGLSLLLDLFASILSGGLATYEITQKEIESGLSQVFVVMDIERLGDHSTILQIIQNIITDYHHSSALDEKTKITYPGERVLQTRKINLADGIPVVKKIWDDINQLK